MSDSKDYRIVYVPGSQTLVRAHRILVEKICKIKLASQNVIHHRDGNGHNNSNKNLVVCENDAYHNLIERREKAYRASGNPNFVYCAICKTYDDPKNPDMVWRLRNRNSYIERQWKHKSCHAKYEKERKRKIMERENA